MNEELKIKISAVYSDAVSGTKKVKDALKGVGEEAEDAGRKGDSAFSKIGSAASKAGAAIAKGMAAGIAACATGVAALTKAAIESYAEYEQLSGGIETMFKGASDEVMQYASNAYKTAGLSANEYMTQATSFSAALIKSLGGDTAAAAKVADMAITDMADNANKMGTSITDIQNAYQGFAKQNYTMLDNLKLGYGGTKEEMEKLLADAEKLTGIKYDINNLNDVYEAIHVIQEEMGITGTTAKEAMETISGSVAMTKAAWSNLLTGIADDNANFEQLINNFVESASAAFGNLMPRIVTALNGISELINAMVPVIVEQIPVLIESVVPKLLSAGVNLIMGLLEGIISALPALMSAVVDIVPQLISSLLSMLPAIITAGVQIITSLISGIAQMLPEVVRQVIQIIPQIVEALVGAAPQLLAAGIELLMAIVEAVPIIVQELVAAIPQIVNSLTTYLTQAIPILLQGAIQLLMAIVDAIPQIIPVLVAAIPQIINSIVTFLTQNIPLLVTAAIQLFMALVQAVPQIIPPLIGAIPQIITAIVEALIAAIPQVLEAAFEMFMAIPQAIGDMLPDLDGALGDAFDSIKSFFDDTEKEAERSSGNTAKTVSSKFSEMSNTMSQKTKTGKDSAVKNFGELQSQGSSKLSGLSSSASSSMSSTASSITSNLSSAKGSGIGSFNTLNAETSKVMNTMKNTTKASMQAVKNSANFSWSLPRLALPRISVSGRFSINPPSVPRFSIAWYAKGGVFDSPHLFGYGNGQLGGLGENGAEAVVPLENNLGWLDRLATMLNEKQGGGNQTIVMKVDEKAFAEVAVGSINNLTRQRGSIPLVVV